LIITGVLTGEVNRELDALDRILPAVLKVILQEVEDGDVVANSNS